MVVINVRGDSMKKIFLFVIGLLMLTNICFADYQYKTFWGANNLVHMEAPTHWVQRYPGTIGNRVFLIDLHSPDDKASVYVSYSKDKLAYNDFSEMREDVLELLVANDLEEMKNKYPSMVINYVNTNYNYLNQHKAVLYVIDSTFPQGKYRYMTIKFLKGGTVYSVVVMAHSYLINDCNWGRMVNSVVLK